MHNICSCLMFYVLSTELPFFFGAGGLVYSFGELLWRDLSVQVSAPVLEVSLLGRNVVCVAAGGFHCGALSEQGNVYMWGENTGGQCGLTERGVATNLTGRSMLPSYPSSLSTACSFYLPWCLHPVRNPLFEISSFPFFCMDFIFFFNQLIYI